MVIIVRHNAPVAAIEKIKKEISKFGLDPHVLVGSERTVIGIIGDRVREYKDQLACLPYVERAITVSKPYKLVSRESHSQDSVVQVGNVRFGSAEPQYDGSPIPIIAGPCSVESRTQIIETAFAVKEAGAHMLRGGAYKPRTSPYAFQGLGVRGLEYLAEAGAATGLPTITEVMDPALVPFIASYVDMLQIGTRNMQNYALLHAVGHSGHPVMLKRGMSAQIQEWLLCAEYIMYHGNANVILCERGIRTFERATRNTFDVNAIPVARHLSHLPIVADPSHGVG
ncbi:MAG TPA: 3-deoxy-7-phosphoheptulonate synthase, partial [Anaerolineae bacterium]|nr:3-deoxy-7-phosphoheptulonate synthase [Anaerolineae bacterium]